MKKRFLSLITAAALILAGCAESNNSELPEESAADNSAAAKPAEISQAFDPDAGNIPEAVIATGEKYAVITIKDYGPITIKLYPEFAPVAAEKFAEYADSGFYDGKIMHRIMKDFMMQGGSKNGDGMSDAEGESFSVETSPSMRHFYGALCMAKDGAGRVGSQFYIVNNKNPNTFEENLTNLEENVDYIKSQYDEALALQKAGELDQETVDYIKGEYDRIVKMIDTAKETPEAVVEKYGRVGGVPFLDGDYTVLGQTVDGFDVIDKLSEIELEYSGTELSKPVTEVVIESIEIKTKD